MLLQGAYNTFTESNYTTLMVSFITREQHVAALYDACHLIVDTYFQTDLLDIYVDHKLTDSHRLQATCREVMNLIAEGSIK